MDVKGRISYLTMAVSFNISLESRYSGIKGCDLR
jgi:hypothetical protein